MLKALELVGFKSFADKTRLEFPAGITVVVGPNGSGKSNIVDAVKWVLGEQSVKSLRGREMADCIFNGSASRRPLNSAETTLTFDNSQRLLAVDTAEVQITRRVYRSGEGEYLINRQPCRLRDIRDLFAGTGVATEAYSIIEQGKVDVLLQSSPRERRLIFEEAAGISRFKAKKVEALRRLERVEQNLLRLSDIVDEVESRLRAVRLQAAKARRYKEYVDRLQELRTQVGLADWRKSTASLEALQSELSELHEQCSNSTAQAETLEARATALDVEIESADEQIRAGQARVAQNRERIASYEATIEHERNRSADLEEEVARHRRQLTAMNVRAGDLEQQLREIAEALDEARRSERQTARQLAEEERALTKVTAEWDAVRTQNEQYRAGHLEQLRASAVLGNRISALEARVAAARGVQERSEHRLRDLVTSRESLSQELEPLRARLAELERESAEREGETQALDEQVHQRRRDLAQAQQDLARLRERHTGATERAAVLEELEKQLEGVGAGAKEILLRARDAASGPFRHIRGLVADVLHVNVEVAALVEIALGEVAQHVVVDSSADLLDYLEREKSRLPGRVGFLRRDADLPANAALSLDDRPGVIARVDRFVQTPDDLSWLPERVLGNTWFVETIADALALAREGAAGQSFVARDGTSLSADGIVAFGPRQTTSGLISRRSELRVLRQQLNELAHKIESGRSRCTDLESKLSADDAQRRALSQETDRLREQLHAQQLRTGAAEQRQVQLDQQHQLISAELSAATTDHDSAVQSLVESQTQLARAVSQLQALEERLKEGEDRACQLEQARQRHFRQTSSVKVDLARYEQQIGSLEAQRAQLLRDQQERERALAESRTQLALDTARAVQSQRSILKCESEVAELYLRKEALARQAASIADLREGGRRQKAEIIAEAQRHRARLRKIEAKLHAKELAAGQVRHERTTLADRMREDYAIELAELEHVPSAEEIEQRDAIEHEIADLRSKINSIGGVNLDALSELEDLETRFASLSAQHTDLTSAKNSLEQIIGRINADSRRLFAETLEVVREHFEALFRKLFGGGHADIVLEEGVDILDSGIEILARPPGKEPRNISLLSGGEKTLTCVALLLAIFRSRPSPFCILDEVDAALDEANIERFIAVLNEFLAWTQFIVVTHSKKTMTCANTLYGITMQESGVSKQVSVRFEDVSENGEFTNFTELSSAPRAGAGDVDEADDVQAA